MNSDRQKAEQRDALAVLAEVEQYILQGKRDPQKVAEYLRPIIGKLGKLLFASGDESEFLEEVKTKTLSHEIKWWYQDENMVTEIMEDGIYYSIITATGNFLEGNTFLRIYSPPYKSMTYMIDLNRADKKFFALVLKDSEKQ